MNKRFLIARRWIAQKFPDERIKGAQMDINFETGFMVPFTSGNKQ
jgi:hypothetical protein